MAKKQFEFVVDIGVIGFFIMMGIIMWGLFVHDISMDCEVSGVNTIRVIPEDKSQLSLYDSTVHCKVQAPLFLLTSTLKNLEAK